MQFSDTTNNDGILQRCEDFCGFDFGDITGSSDLKDKFTNYVNDAMDDAWHIVFDNYTGWQFDDTNKSDLPIATTDLNNSDHKYSLPSEAVTIKDIEIQQDDGEGRQVQPLKAEQISQFQAEDEFLESDGTPRYYKVVGRTIELYPAPDYDKTDGLKVYFDRGMTDFSSSDTTKEPGFAGPYHILIPLKASVRWRELNTPDDTTLERLQQKALKKGKELGGFYNDRWEDDKPSQMMVGDSVKSNI